MPASCLTCSESTRLFGTLAHPVASSASLRSDFVCAIGSHFGSSSSMSLAVSSRITKSRRGSCSAMSKTLPNSEWLAEQKCSSTTEIFCYSAPPLIHVGHLSENDRDAAFWHGFHPADCDVIWPHLLSKNPFRPLEVSFSLEDVFSCARRVFAYQFSFSFSFGRRGESLSPGTLDAESPSLRSQC